MDGDERHRTTFGEGRSALTLSSASDVRVFFTRIIAACAGEGRMGFPGVLRSGARAWNLLVMKIEIYVPQYKQSALCAFHSSGRTGETRLVYRAISSRAYTFSTLLLNNTYL
jgi:hypothetical protein